MNDSSIMNDTRFSYINEDLSLENDLSHQQCVINFLLQAVKSIFSPRLLFLLALGRSQSYSSNHSSGAGEFSAKGTSLNLFFYQLFQYIPILCARK